MTISKISRPFILCLQATYNEGSVEYVETVKHMFKEPAV